MQPGQSEAHCVAQACLRLIALIQPPECLNSGHVQLKVFFFCLTLYEHNLVSHDPAFPTHVIVFLM